MKERALITKRGATRTASTAKSERAAAKSAGFKVEFELPHATLIQGDEKGFAVLERQGYRVKRLRDTNILGISGYRIEIEKPLPRLPAKLTVPKNLARTWPHHLVQFIAPPIPEWIRQIESRGVDVVGTLSSYAAFVMGKPADVAALKKLPFVTWTGAFQPAYRVGGGLLKQKGKIRWVNIGVYPREEIETVRQAVVRLKGEILIEAEGVADTRGKFGRLLVEINASRLAEIACLPFVHWLEYQPPARGDGERESQIVAGNLGGDPINPAPLNDPRYLTWLNEIELGGDGVVIAIVDSGVKSDHLDLAGRQFASVDYTNGVTPDDAQGHGTHVAGIAVGNGESQRMNDGFLSGLGVAPRANYVNQNFIAATALINTPNQIALPSYSKLCADAQSTGAHVMNNSWATENLGEYSQSAAVFDRAVRDANPETAAPQSLCIVFSAGNIGGAEQTIGATKQSKNTILVGNSLNRRPNFGFSEDNVRGIFGGSSRGPAKDGRILPTVVAPGTDVRSTHTGNTTSVGDGTGTSQAAPHISGVCALLLEFFRTRFNHVASPALLKAMLIIGADDLAQGPNWRSLNALIGDRGMWTKEGEYFKRQVGFRPVEVASDNGAKLSPVNSTLELNVVSTWFFDSVSNTLYVRPPAGSDPMIPAFGPATWPVHALDSTALGHIPNGDQGWGRANLQNSLFRGPKHFADQPDLAFTSNDQVRKLTASPVDPSRPMRITLVWTDAPALAGSNPALVNDLDLEVLDRTTGNIFKGGKNNFQNGFTVPGGESDQIDNIECVYIEHPAGFYEISVICASLRADARSGNSQDAIHWQDFALVLDNAEIARPSPMSVVTVLDRSGSMIAYGYEQAARISSKQFIDSLSADDRIGIVSFGNTARVEFPSGTTPVLEAITETTRADAKAAIDGVVFGGCTFMGDGITQANNLLAAGGTDKQAMVLLSDGRDNRGCRPNDATRVSAIDATRALPDEVRVYTCAMGPAADQTLLQQIATETNGRYYYMPVTADMLEVYNYIRAQVTGESLVVNEIASASSSRVAVPLETGVEELTLTVGWMNPRLHFVPGEPTAAEHVSVRLRDPHGRLSHPDNGFIRRVEGPGHVVFELHRPLAGQWYVEVSTHGDTHVQYTVGGFVRSSLRMDTRPRLDSGSGRSAPNSLRIAARVQDGNRPIHGCQVQARVVAPTFNIAKLLKSHRTQLGKISLPSADDSLAPSISRLMIYRDKLLRAGKPDLFTNATHRLSLKDTDAKTVSKLGLEKLFDQSVKLRSGGKASLAQNTGIYSGLFKDVGELGSYNVIITASGFSPVTGSRFVRKDMLSVVMGK